MNKSASAPTIGAGSNLSFVGSVASRTQGGLGRSATESSLAAMREHVKDLLRTTGTVDQYFSKAFESKAEKIFGDCDVDNNGMLQGRELRDAVIKMLPPGQQEALRHSEDCEGFTDDDRSMFEIVQCFSMLTHTDSAQTGGCGVNKGCIADFARFCVAWRIYAYFNSSKVVHAGRAPPKIDVIFVGGPNVARRENVISQLFAAYHDDMDFPVSTTDRPANDWEIEGVHHFFVTPERFDKKKKDGELLTYFDGPDGRYGYTFYSLMQPPKERHQVTIFPALKDSEVGLKLRLREKKLGDVRVKQVYLDAPLETTDAVEEVAGSLQDYYKTRPEEWAEELGRRNFEWDLLVEGDREENAAYHLVEAQIAEWLEQGSHKMYAGTDKQAKVDRLSAEQLFETMSHANAGEFAHAGFRHITDDDCAKLYARTAGSGMDQEFMTVYSGKEGSTRPSDKEIAELATKRAGADGRMQVHEFEGFMQDISDISGVEAKELVGVMAFTFQGALQLDNPDVEAHFRCVPKQYKKGREFTKSEFCTLCRNCDFIGKGFTQGDAEMVFSAVAKKSKAMKVKKKKEQQCGGGGKAHAHTLHSVADFEVLVTFLAERMKMPPYKVMTRIKATAKEVGGGK